MISTFIKKNQKTVLCIVAFIVLALGFYNNFWNVASGDWFEGFANGTESWVIGRLAQSNAEGVFSEGGLLGREIELPAGENEVSYQYEIYSNDLPIENYLPYMSNPALQGTIFSLLDLAFGFSPQTNVQLFRFIAATTSAAILVVYLLWVLDVFGFFSAVVTMFLLTLSPWLTVSGGHIYWIFGTIYLPFLVPLLLLHREYKGREVSAYLWFGCIALSVLVKTLFTGYEFITTTLIMMTVPIFFYGLWHKWERDFFIRRFFVASLGGIFGVIVCAIILSFQIGQAQGGGLQDGWAHIQNRLIVRTYPDAELLQKDIPDYIEATNDVSVIEVIGTYLGNRALSLPVGNPLYGFSFGFLLAVFAIFSAVIVRNMQEGPLRALTITTWISILAPLSWLVIFKSHSVLHTHLNYLTWYMPTFLTMFTAFSAFNYDSLRRSSRIKRPRRKRRK